MTESNYATGRDEAERLLKWAQGAAIHANTVGETFTADALDAVGHMAALATAHGVLAIADRLAELVALKRSEAGGHQPPPVADDSDLERESAEAMVSE